MWNVPFNGLGAAMDLSTDQLIANAGGQSLVEELMREVVATAAAIGIRLPEEIIRDKIEQTRKMGVYFTSMQLDRRLGRPIERDAIVGRPLEIAESSGVKSPFLKVLDMQLRSFSVGV